MKKLALCFIFVLCAMPAWAQVPAHLSGGINLKDEGVTAGRINQLDCMGATISCSKSDLTGTVTISEVSTRRVCMLHVGDGTNNIADADMSPFKANRCYIPYAATVLEITAQGDAGTTSFIVERRRDAATLADLLSGALASAGTTEVCAMASTAQTCINGTTSSGTITLSNTALAAGDWIEIKNGTAAGSTKALDIAVVFTVD